MTLGSLFDGIGGWLLAAEHAGVKPVWASEIDDFPAAVTAYHFPKVKQLGDITKIDPDKLDPVDIICAGSPCQDLSVAGKREGLKGERSGLFRTAIDIVHRLRDRTGKPRYFVWENVPGAFSSNKGLDFRAVLEEISQTEIPMPASGKWANAGVVEWGNGSLAWRVLDAQYLGVAQRRKRIFLVADFGGFTAGEILFECKSVCRDFEKGRSKGEDASEGAGRGFESAVIRMRSGCPGGGKGPLVSKEKSLNLGCNNDQYLYDMTHADEVMRPVGGDKANCLNGRMGTGGNQVPVVHCIAGNIIGRDSKNGGNHFGVDRDLSFTLNTADRHAVCVGNGQLHQTQLSRKAGALNTMHDQQCVIFRHGGFADYTRDTKTGNLRASGGDIGGGSKNLVMYNTVRRLTPTECERLQGLPDGYTDIEFKGKPAPDSRRYKSLGNGMAQPCADWIIRRIVSD